MEKRPQQNSQGFLSAVVTTVLFVLMMIGLAMCRAHGAEPSDRLVAALIQVESGGNDHALGDKHLKDHAYGVLQIRQLVVDDYNRWCGTTYRAQDCLGNSELSIKICRKYIGMYVTEKRLGHK